MFKIEVKFRVGERDVPLERFVALFVAEALRSAQTEIQPKPVPVPRPPTTPSWQAPKPKTEPRAVGINEAARLLSLSPATIRAYVSRWKIPCVRIGRRVLIPPETINELVGKGLPTGH